MSRIEVCIRPSPVCHTIDAMRGGKGLVLGLDSGTQSCSAGVFALDGRPVGSGRAPLRVRTPREGWAEQDPREWWQAAREALRRALSGLDSRRALALGVAFQRETFSLTDGRGRYLRPGILWLDVRSIREVRELGKIIGGSRFHRRTGKPLDTSCALPRLFWLRRHERGLLTGAARWIDVGAALAESLTGRAATCVSGADTCGLIGLRDRGWIGTYLDLAGARKIRFPDLVEPGERIGSLSRTAARETGLPQGLPVIAAGGDGQVFPVGAGIRCANAVSLTMGTSIVLGISSSRPYVSPAFRTLLCAPGSYLLECVLQSGTYLLKWFLSSMADERAETESSWERRARAVPPGCEGLVTLPHWWGVRFPESLPDMRGLTAGWSNHHSRAHLYRSLLEGVAFELKRAFHALSREFPGRVSGPVHAGGGGMMSGLWEEILADVLGRPVRRSRRREACALGAAVWAAVGIGAFPSLAAASESMCSLTLPVAPRRRQAALYARIFREVYVPLFKASIPPLNRLTRIR